MSIHLAVAAAAALPARSSGGLVDELLDWVVRAAVWRMIARLPTPVVAAVLVVGLALLVVRRRGRA